jgi:hypothetical protein
MSNFVEQLRLAEMAAENIYFAKLDRELIESLHNRMQAKRNSVQSFDPAQAPPGDGRAVLKAASGG